MSNKVLCTFRDTSPMLGGEGKLSSWSVSEDISFIFPGIETAIYYVYSICMGIKIQLEHVCEGSTKFSAHSLMALDLTIYCIGPQYLALTDLGPRLAEAQYKVLLEHIQLQFLQSEINNLQPKI